MKNELLKIKAAITNSQPATAIIQINALIKKLETDRTIVIEQLIKNEFGLNFKQLAKKGALMKFYVPRQLAMHLLLKYSSLSLKDVAEKFNRAESVCYHSNSRVMNRVKYDSTFRNMVEKIEKQIKDI